MAHLKRQKVPKNWPIKRKGTTFIVKPLSNTSFGIPVLIILRDVLKLAKTKKEVKKALHSKNILLNGKVVKDERTNAVLFDVISILPSKKYYKIDLSAKGKFDVKEIKEIESHKKIVKIIDKKTLKGKKIQLNLKDGRNFLSEIECKVKDSVLINFKDKKIEKCIPLKEKAKAFVIAGKHSGKIGIIEKIKDKMVELKIEKNKINILTKQLMVLE
jgi:small subunit ribosomal protein S4e